MRARYVTTVLPRRLVQICLLFPYTLWRIYIVYFQKKTSQDFSGFQTTTQNIGEMDECLQAQEQTEYQGAPKEKNANLVEVMSLLVILKYFKDKFEYTYTITR